jgi:hypothetical protein
LGHFSPLPTSPPPTSLSYALIVNYTKLFKDGFLNFYLFIYLFVYLFMAMLVFELKALCLPAKYLPLEPLFQTCFCFFSSDGDLTQGLKHGRQVVCH